MRAGISLIAVLCAPFAFAHAHQDHAPAAPEGQREVRAAAQHLLGSLDDGQREQVLLAFEDDERFNFHFTPRSRQGLMLKNMTQEQRIATHTLLQTVLSSQGYLKVTGIIHLEEILHHLQDRSPRRDPEQYYITFFGEPSAEDAWGWRFEGHHLSLNFSSVTGELFSNTPAFFGTNPAEVRTGPYTGMRVLAAEEDLARALVRSLDARQRERAVFAATAPRDIVTGNARNAILERFEGLPASAMTDEQRAMLWRIVEEYAHNLRRDMADAQLEQIRAAGIEHLHFGWAGSTEPGEPHYYRIHGPSVLFEYDNVQNDANHIHTVWRDLHNDFGDDLLQRHYEAAPSGHGHDH